MKPTDKQIEAIARIMGRPSEADQLIEAIRAERERDIAALPGSTAEKSQRLIGRIATWDDLVNMLASSREAWSKIAARQRSHTRPGDTR